MSEANGLKRNPWNNCRHCWHPSTRPLVAAPVEGERLLECHLCGATKVEYGNPHTPFSYDRTRG